MNDAKVLVVDDDDDVLDLVRLELAKAGLRSDGARTAEEGLAKMGKRLYPVVVLDIHMPGMNGVEMLAALKRHNSLVQVIMLTADASLQRVIECMDRGASDFFAKRESLYPLIEAVAGALGRAARWTSWIGNRGTPRETAAAGRRA